MSDSSPQSNPAFGAEGAARSSSDGAPWPDASDLVLGDDVEVIEELGRGAQTAVYRVRRAGVEYALKVLTGVGLDDQSALVGFRREAALLARVNHPGVPQVFEVGLTGGHPYLILELIEGQPLGGRLHDGPLTEREVVRLGLDVAAALHAAQRAGLVHRDVKPDNVVLTGSGRARVIDFGLAASRTGVAGDAVVGTFDYSAPEQTGMLARPVDGRADLYALGVVLFQCATGQLPYRTDDVGRLLALHATAPVPDPRTLRPDLSADLAALIVALMAKDPDDRVQTAQELHAALTPLAATSPDEMREGSAPARMRLPAADALVGRESERERLSDCWRRAWAGRGGIVLLEGPPGVGKSSLAHETMRAARSAGALVLSGKCDADSALPLAPLRTAVDGHVRTVMALPEQQRIAAIADLQAAAGVDAGVLRPLSPALAAVLDAPQLAGEDRRDQFATAVASFVSALAVRHGGVLLLIDDVQWLDPASRDVLRRLADGIAAAPLLLLATARDDDSAAEAVAAFAADSGAHLDLRLPMGPLDDMGTARLVASYLAGSTVGADVTAELTARGRGNPFTILEYLHALIEQGALRPSWGTWLLDTDRLRAIDLPTDVFELVLARINDLGQPAHDILTVAAALGSHFEPDLLSGVVSADPTAALTEASDRGLLHRGIAGYTFVHDRIREALLSEVEPAALSALHRRIAMVLATQDRSDPPHIYALASHFASGGLDHDPDRVFATGWSAGQLALAEYAPDAAVSFLETAAAAAAAAHIEPDSQFREALAVAYLACGDVAAAGAQLEPALIVESVPLRRAALLLQLAHVRRTQWRMAEAIGCIRDGLAELGTPVPSKPPAVLLSALATAVGWLLTGGRKPVRQPAEGESAQRLRLHAELCRAGSSAAAFAMRYALGLSFNLAGSRYVHRLGRSHEYAMTNTVMALMAAGLRMSGRAQRLSRQAGEIATELGDPQVSAFIAWMHEYAENAGGAANIARWADVAERTRPWLEADLYLHTIRLRAYDLVLRGYGDEALTWIERAQSRVVDPHDEQYFRITLTEAAARSLLGQEVDPPSVVARLGESGLEPGQAAQIAICALPLLLEQDELGEPFDTVIGEFDRLQIPPLALHREDRLIFVAEVFGRLTRCQRAAEPQRAALVAAATKAERRLGRLANSPLLRGYHRVAKASLSQLSGEPAAALSLLAAADKHVVRLDAPLVHFEAARVRARALRALGEDALWRQHADQAFALAARHGWSRRQRSVRAEFGVANATRTGGRTRQSDSVGNRYRRRLEALQQVSAAAATVIDPHQVARVALDETLRILGAERAILFLCDDDGRPRPSLGRTGAGELTELTGYSASLVERVAADRTSLVVTGSEEGAALGSRSAVVHGLRSIMMAPLELDGQLLGVLYLDSRVAKGVFTDEDIDILTAVTNQVAVSLKTAQAAQLEVAVQTARQQRDTAEALREAMNELAATLDPEQVLHGLRDITARTLSTDRVCLLHRDGDALTVATGGDPEPDVAIDIAALAAIGPRIGDGASIPTALAPMCDGVDGWLMTPLTTRGHGVGVLVAWSSSPDGFSQAELDIASALAGQGATAYANARLFAQVQLLATTDGLTGIFNRRHFSDLATRQLDIAVRNNRPMAGMMIDIDHFKRINDSCGHGIGDDVIKAVAGVLQASLREPDVLCRYGGEEFAVVLSEMHGDPMAVAERLREAVESLAIPGPAGAVRPTVSVGVVDLKPDDQLESLLGRADEALYRAKAAGRNRVKSG